MADEKDPKEPEIKAETEAQKALNEEKERAIKLEREAQKLRQSSVQQAKAHLAELEAEKLALDELGNSFENTKRKKQIETEIARQANKLAKEEIKDKLALGKITQEQATRLLADIKLKEKKLKLDDEEIEKTKELNSALKQSMFSFLGLEAVRKTTTAGMIQTAQELGQISTQVAQTGISMDQLYGSFLSLDSIADRSGKSFGVFVGQVASAEGGMTTLTQYGAGFKEINESMMGLRMSMAGFSDESAAMQSYLAGNATKMKNLGVSAEEQGKSLNFLTKSLRMSGTQASQTLDNLGKVAISAGIPVKNLLRDFGQIGPQLAAQGPKAVEIFSNLAKQAKSLGVEVSDLMGVFGQAMDTFEGAATAAGKFNAVMGGDYLNAMQLLNATEDQRVEIVKRQMDATGKNFETMSKYEKIAVANALGIKDVNTAQMMLAGSTEEMRKKKEKEAATQEQLNKLQADAVDVATKLGSVFQVVYGAMLPFLEIIQKVANWITWLNDKGKGIPGITIVGLLMAKMLGMLTTKMFETKVGFVGLAIANYQATAAELGHAAALRQLFSIKAGGGLLGLLNFLPLLIMLFEGLHDTLEVPHSPILMDTLSNTLPAAFNAIGNSLQPLIKPMLAFGAAMLMVGGGVYLAATGLSNFIKSFASLNTEQLVVAGIALMAFGLGMTTIVTTMAGLATSGVGTIGVALMLAFGAAIMMVGAGVWLAAEGMKNLVESMKTLTVEQGANIAGSLYMIAGGVGALLASLLAFGAGSLLGGGIGLLMLSGAIVAIGASLDKFPAEKSINFTASMNSLRDALKEIKTTTEADIEPAVKLMKTVKEYAVVKEKTSDDDPLVKLLKQIKELLETAPAAAAGGAGTYEIKIDGDTFGKLVKKNAPNPLQAKGAGVISYGG
jgi:hypothetical protein